MPPREECRPRRPGSVHRLKRRAVLPSACGRFVSLELDKLIASPTRRTAPDMVWPDRQRQRPSGRREKKTSLHALAKTQSPEVIHKVGALAKRESAESVDGGRASKRLT